MPSFLISSPTGTSQTLANGQGGIVAHTGVITTTSDAITATGAFNLYVAGGVASRDSAVDATSGTMEVSVTEAGYMLGEYAINSNDMISKIYNAGTLSGHIVAALFQGSGNDIITNAGTITGSFGINASASFGALQVVNTGTIETEFSGIVGSTLSDTILNTGAISGVVELGGGNDVFKGIKGLQTDVRGGSGNDLIMAGASAETLYGDFDNDRIFGNGGGDTIFGGQGNDVMRGGAAADAFDGGSDTDWVYYQNSDAGVEVDLTSGFGFGGFAEGDTYVDVENIWGSQFRDELNGSNDNNYLVGGGANDIMRGYAGNDQFRGDGGADVMNGGAGFDRLVYAASNGAVNVNLTTGSASGGHATGDVFFNMEYLTGSQYGDRLTGSTGNNQINGLDGDDIIRGYLGNDLMNGGDGADTFVFDNNGGNDIIVGFQNDVDKLDLRAYNYSSVNQVLNQVSVSGNDVFITRDANDSIRLVGFAENFNDLADDLII